MTARIRRLRGEDFEGLSYGPLPSFEQKVGRMLEFRKYVSFVRVSVKVGEHLCIIKKIH